MNLAEFTSRMQSYGFAPSILRIPGTLQDLGNFYMRSPRYAGGGGPPVVDDAHFQAWPPGTDHPIYQGIDRGITQFHHAYGVLPIIDGFYTFRHPYQFSADGTTITPAAGGVGNVALGATLGGITFSSADPQGNAVVALFEFPDSGPPRNGTYFAAPNPRSGRPPTPSLVAGAERYSWATMHELSHALVAPMRASGVVADWRAAAGWIDDEGHNRDFDVGKTAVRTDIADLMATTQARVIGECRTDPSVVAA